MRVVKVGGSLFRFGGLPAVLRDWLAAQAPAANVLLAGGGELADVIRRADQTFAVGQERAHWLCIDAMSVSARLLAALLPEAAWAAGLEQLRQAISRHDKQPLIFDAAEFLRKEEPSLGGSPVPHTWAVTSDSIAGRLAQALGAEELVLLKSAKPPLGATRRSTAAAGYVDQYFPAATRSVRLVRCVDLRDAAWAEVELP
jgi:aspartokinase-like uncharacterized kinase